MIVLPMMLLLTACEIGRSETVVKIVCPTIRQYDNATLDRALKEYQALPPGSAIKMMIGDYRSLRAKIMVCRK